MKALRFRTFGSPSVLTIEEIPKPELHDRENEALIQVKAAAINPSDVKNVSGHFSGTTLPRTPGRDFSGIVVEGKAHQGEEVWGSVPGLGITRDGSHAEYVVVPIEGLSRRPSTLTMEQAAAIGVPFITAWVSLINAAQIETGETVLIVGAAGAVGQAATQIANWQKVRVLGAARSSGPIAGVDAVINTLTEDLPARVRELTDGKGVDAVLDAVGGALFEPALRSLRPRGRQIAITSTGDPRVSFNLVDFYHNRLRLIGVDSNGLTLRELSEITENLRIRFEANDLRPPSIEIVPFEKAISAYEKVAGGKSRTKQVLRIS